MTIRYVPPPPARRRSTAPRGARTAALGAVAGLLVAAVTLAVALGTGILRWGGSEHLQGPGFDSPEQAALVYLDAVKNLDPHAMRAAHAIESYAQHCDGVAQAERLRVWAPNITRCEYPGDEPDALALKINSRLSTVSNTNTMVLMVLIAPQLWNDGKTTAFEDADDIDAFFTQTGSDLAAFRGGWGEISPAGASEMPDGHEDYLPDFAEQYARGLGVSPEDLAFPLYIFELHGKKNYFSPTVVRYDSRWYLVEPLSPLTTLLGVSAPGIGQITS